MRRVQKRLSVLASVNSIWIRCRVRRSFRATTARRRDHLSSTFVSVVRLLLVLSTRARRQPQGLRDKLLLQVVAQAVTDALRVDQVVRTSPLPAVVVLVRGQVVH